MSTVAYWARRLRQALCQHRFVVVGSAVDRHRGECDVQRCRWCGAYRQMAKSERALAPQPSRFYHPSLSDEASSR